MKRFLSILLCALTLCALAAPAQAVPAVEYQETETRYVQVSGKVTGVNAAAGQITIERADGGGALALNVNENTAIVNNATRGVMRLSQIRKGSTIYAWHDRATTRSLPPQSYAYAITANVKANATVGMFFEADCAVANADGSVTMLNEARDLYLTFPKATSLRILGTGKKLALSDIRPGERFFAWYDVVMESYPGQANTKKAVALPYAYEGSIRAQGGKVFVNGKEVGATLTSKGEAMVPARAVAEALGCTVEATSRSATLRRGTTTATFTRGKGIFQLNGTDAGTAAPIRKNGVLYIALDAFGYLGNYKLVYLPAAA